jgi:hypothetical protein
LIHLQRQDCFQDSEGKFRRIFLLVTRRNGFRNQ